MGAHEYECECEWVSLWLSMACWEHTLSALLHCSSRVSLTRSLFPLSKLSTLSILYTLFTLARSLDPSLLRYLLHLRLGLFVCNSAAAAVVAVFAAIVVSAVIQLCIRCVPFFFCFLSFFFFFSSFAFFSLSLVLPLLLQFACFCFCSRSSCSCCLHRQL